MGSKSDAQRQTSLGPGATMAALCRFFHAGCPEGLGFRVWGLGFRV